MHNASAERPIPLATKRARLRADIATHRLLMAAMWLRLLTEKANFDPGQPRVPAGDPAGGQWTGGAGGGARFQRIAGGNEEDTKPNRSIIDEFADPTAEARTEAFNNMVAQLRQIEPNNPQLTYVTGPDYTPSFQALQDMQAELDAARNRVAYQIGQGHAFDEHADEFGASTSADLSSIVRSVINDPSAEVGSLSNGRTLFYDRASNTLVIVDPNSEDSGSIYKPRGGQSYVNRLLKGK